ACRHVAQRGGRLVALWGSDARAAEGNEGRGFVIHAALAGDHGLVVLSHPLASASYPDLAAVFPCAERMQRATFDLLGISAAGADHRKWLRHAAWKENEFPLRKDFNTGLPLPVADRADDYPFVRVEGEGVHEIAVGPVHAGTIEPGHFRFSVVGE